MIDPKSFSSALDSAILSVFPRVATHLKHTTDQSLSTQLFPHDNIIAALAVSFNRYTVKYPNESKISRLVWSALLGWLAYMDYEYWILISLHLVSFGQYAYGVLMEKFQTSVSFSLDVHTFSPSTILFCISQLMSNVSCNSCNYYVTLFGNVGEKNRCYSNDSTPIYHDLCICYPNLFDLFHCSS